MQQFQNVLLTKVKTMTPYESVLGHKPDLSELHVFGEKAYVHIPTEQRTKLKSKAQKMTFVGYSLQHKGYRMIYLESNKIVMSRNVRLLVEDEQNIFSTEEVVSKDAVE